MTKTFNGLDEFAEGISKLADKFPKEIAREIAKATIQGFSVAVLATPVDTGFARSNWHVGIDNLPSVTREAFSPGIQLGLGDTANAQGAISAGTKVLKGFTEKNSTIFLVNTADYSSFLDEGSSKQAPAGMSAAAVLVINAKLNKINIEAIKRF